MRLFGTAAIVVALATSHCAAQFAERAPIQFSRAEPQKGRSLHERKLSRDKKKKHHHHGEVTETEATPIAPEDMEFERSHTRQGNPTCSVCGEGKKVGNPDANVVFPGQSGQIPCRVLEQMGTVGLIPAAQCAVLPQLISTICECEPSDVPTTTTVAPTTPAATTEATKPGKSKSNKQSLSFSLSFSIPSKAGKSIHGKSTEPTKSSGKHKTKTVITTKSSKTKSSTSKGSKMIASKASGKSDKSKSSGESGESGESGVMSWESSTLDAKAEKVSASSKAAKAVSPKAKKSSTKKSSTSKKSSTKKSARV
jgi:hypothetical protein